MHFHALNSIQCISVTLIVQNTTQPENGNRAISHRNLVFQDSVLLVSKTNKTKISSQSSPTPLWRKSGIVPLPQQGRQDTYVFIQLVAEVKKV